jgi:hypothetical protein
LELNELSWRPAFFIAADEEPVFGDEVFGFWLAAAVAAATKTSAKKRHGHSKTPHFRFFCLTLVMLVFGCNLSSRVNRGAPHKVVDNPFYLA